jgi:hypothetical protein
MQKPGEVGSAQYWQVPLQALWQQTPSTQKLLEHSLAARQLAPIGFGPQVIVPLVPGRQAVPTSQSSTDWHDLVQAPSTQRKGWQSCTPGGRHLPRPSQVPAVFSRLPVHDGSRHWVSRA